MLRKFAWKHSIFLFCTTLSIGCAQQAWSLDKISEESVRELYKQSMIVMIENDTGKRLSFLENHTHTNYTVTYKTPIAASDGTLSKTFESKANRQQFIYNAMNASSEVFKTIGHELLFVSISPDGKSAQAKDRMKIPNNMENSTFEATMECEDSLILNDQGVIQFIESRCSWIVPEDFKHPKPQ